jgi:hypothetical protein
MVDFKDTLRERVETARLRFQEARSSTDPAVYGAALEEYRAALRAFADAVLRGR